MRRRRAGHGDGARAAELTRSSDCPPYRPSALTWPAWPPDHYVHAVPPRADVAWKRRYGRIGRVRHVYECPLRWADMDALGHVNNVRYVDYLQEARADMLAVYTGTTAGDDLTEGVVVVQHDLEFVAPLVFRAAPVRIEAWTTQIRAASFTLAYEILDVDADGNRHVYTRATTLLSPYVFTTERPRRLTAQERDVLEQFRGTDDT